MGDAYMYARSRALEVKSTNSTPDLTVEIVCHHYVGYLF